MLALAAVSDDDDDDDASAAGGGVSLTPVLSLLAADCGCVDPDVDDVLPVIHNIHQHLTDSFLSGCFV